MFDVVGFSSPVMDIGVGLEKLPKKGETVEMRDYCWQGGGPVTTGGVASARLGAKVAIIGTVANDIMGHFLYNDSIRHGIDVRNLIFRDGAHTTPCAILSDSETSNRTMIGGSFMRPEPIKWEEVDQELLRNTKIFHIGMVDEVCKKCCDVVHEAGGKVLIDMGGYRPGMTEETFPYVDYFIGSEMCYDGYFQSRGVEDSSETRKANLIKLHELGPEVVIFTLGSVGMCGYSEKDGYFELPAFRVNAIDTVGCGDVFHGAFAAAMAFGMDIKSGARFASGTSAIKATRQGGRCGIPTRPVLEKFLETGEIDYSEIDKRVEYYRRGLDHAFEPEFVFD